MHPLHDYIAGQIVGRLRTRGIVVWYDPRSEFRPFVEELLGEEADLSMVHKADLAGFETSLAVFTGSFLELRARIEPLVSQDMPDPLLLYLPAVARDREGSLLMEVEKAGDCYEPQLRKLARNLLEKSFTAGEIDRALGSEAVDYFDLAGMASGGDLSVLKGIFPGSSGSDEILASWVSSDANDSEIERKGAIPELLKLLKSRIGLAVEGSVLEKLRSIVLRYILGSEFRADLKCSPPAALDSIAMPSSKDLEVVRSMARRLRKSSFTPYDILADRVESELRLESTGIDARYLGSIDTFRFEEKALLDHCSALVARGAFEEAIGIIDERQDSYWLDRDTSRKAQWEAIRRMAELGTEAARVTSALKKPPSSVKAWIEAYSSAGGWHLLDRAQRRMESWISNLEDEPPEAPLLKVRQEYDNVCSRMASGFAEAIEAARWSFEGACLSQTGVYDKLVKGLPKPVAVFLVDSLRFEMGMELDGLLRRSDQISIKAAIAAIPGITPVGMAALLPGASVSYSITDSEGRLGAEISGSFLPDHPARARFMSATIPDLVDITLDRLLGLPSKQLSKQLEGAQVVTVRSQEIDLAGEEATTGQARREMGTIIDNLARAIRKLATLGIRRSVVLADHGHLFSSVERDGSMRVDPPGGDQLQLHRRVWIGRGGSTPSGCRRVSARQLGYQSDLDFVFPPRTAVFRSGGDLAYHHGGLSLQELVIPVLDVMLEARGETKAKGSPLAVSGLPEVIANQIISFQVTSMLGDSFVPVLLSSGRKVGGLYSAVDAASFDRDTGIVRLQPGAPCTVVMRLLDEEITQVEVQLADPATDAELFRSNSITVKLGVL